MSLGNHRKSLLLKKIKQIEKEIILKIQPGYIYAAADFTDPYGTHRECLESVLAIMP